MNRLENLLFSNLWPGFVAWTVLYISDYSLTLKCARLYRTAVSEKIVFEGSFELTPYFQRDIDSLRLLSPRFAAALVMSLLYLTAVWWLAIESQPKLYQFVLGLMISSELAVHLRHVRNLFLFRAIASGDAVQGRIQYSRPLIYRMSSIENLAFSGLFAVLFLFTANWFVLGGVIGCLSLAVKHWRLAGKHLSEASQAAKTGTAEVSISAEAIPR